jgi:hypothetical protein
VTSHSADAVLFGGPMDGERRPIQWGGSEEDIPGEVYLLDSVSTMDSVLAAPAGSPVQIKYQVYRKGERSQAGIWRYNFVRSDVGRFSKDV